MAKTSCSQLSLTESAMYVYAQGQSASYLQCSNEPLRLHARRRLSGICFLCTCMSVRMYVCMYIHEFIVSSVCTYMSL